MIEAFLSSRERADTSMFLRANLRARGLVDEGRPQEGTYVLELHGARVTGVAGFFWNGMILTQADDPEELARAARAAVPTREIEGLGGPWKQIVRARTALGLDGETAAVARPEILYAVSTAELTIPETRAICRPPRPDEHALLAGWRAEFSIEGLGATDGPELREQSAREIDVLVERKVAFVLEDEGRAVAFSAFNAALPDVVQIGGVWTPPENRGKGYARAVVARSIRAWGGPRAVLFTNAQNVAARRAYESIGFVAVDEYGLILF
jgi:RimJ/RimL family protein N-acetyltransferase